MLERFCRFLARKKRGRAQTMAPERGQVARQLKVLHASPQRRFKSYHLQLKLLQRPLFIPVRAQFLMQLIHGVFFRQYRRGGLTFA